jgi:hypothetical protein
MLIFSVLRQMKELWAKAVRYWTREMCQTIPRDAPMQTEWDCPRVLRNQQRPFPGKRQRLHRLSF